MLRRQGLRRVRSSSAKMLVQPIEYAGDSEIWDVMRYRTAYEGIGDGLGARLQS
jgi:hypothetical protein